MSSSNDGLAYACKDCKNKSHAEWVSSNKIKQDEYAKAWHKANPNKNSEYGKRYYGNNKDSAAESHRKWRNKNQEKVRAASKKYYRDNKAAAVARRAKRRAAQIKATPPWFDKEAVECIYSKAKTMRDRGDDVHVDHIIPLQGIEVCGLHWSLNLEIVRAEYNRAKGNRLQ